MHDKARVASSRIEMLDLDGKVAYTANGYAARELAPAESAAAAAGSALGRPHGRAAPLPRQRFDVRRTTCTVESDKERLLSVIEGIGAGFDGLNLWMHQLLVSAQSGVDPEAAGPTPSHRYIPWPLQRASGLHAQAVHPGPSN
jgi:hypothetical protein